MSFIKHCLSYFSPAPTAEKPAGEVERKSIRVTLGALSYANKEGGYDNADPYVFPVTLPNVLPAGHPGMAKDNALAANYAFAANNTIFNEGIMAYPYAYLAQLTQRAEYRNAAEIIAQEMTRKWITLSAIGDGDKTEKIKAIEAEMKRTDMQGFFRKVTELDCYFGRGHLYLDFNDVEVDDDVELAAPLALLPAKIKKNSFNGFKLVEPMWTYPNDYDSTRPLSDSYYKPRSWFIMGQIVNSTRLVTVVTRPVPDLLKPAYQFGGLSLTQMMKPYVDNWLRTRQSVSDLVHAFSITVLKMQMGSALDAGGMENIRKRIQIFLAHRDNRGVYVLDQNTEEMENVSTPLTTLDALQAQSQEQMASVARIPLSVLLGITPTGLNASSEGEIQTFCQTIESMQESGLGHQIEFVLKVMQLSLFGTIDEDITFKFNPLWTMTEKEEAETDKLNAETDQIRIDSGVIDSQEARLRVANEENTPYDGLDPDKIIEPPDDGLDSDEDLLKPGDDDKEQK